VKGKTFKIRLDQSLKATSPPTTEPMVVSLCAAMLSSLLRENTFSLAAVNGLLSQKKNHKKECLVWSL
jgi:hypothetical protein